jgi:hypothetical protein
MQILNSQKAKLVLIFKVLILLISLFAASCSDQTTDQSSVQPQSILTSFFSRAINATPIITDRQTGKTVEGGQYIRAYMQVPFDIKHDQVKTTLLAGLNELIKANKDCKWIVLWLGVGGDHTLGLYTGKGEYKDNKISIGYYTPGQGDIEGSKTVNKKTPDYPILTPYTDSEFKQAYEVFSKYYNYKNSLSDQTYEQRKLMARERMADEFKLSTEKVKKIVDKMFLYYGVSYGVEEVILK